MAEGEHLSRTLDGGSEFLFDYECIQCRHDGSTQEATDFCQDCKQFLCKPCGKYHIRNMRNHTLSVASSQQPKQTTSSVSPIPDVGKCRYHPDRDIEMYCGSHDMVYCCLCIAIKHRSCSSVTEINTVAHKSCMFTLQSLGAEITRVTKLLHDIKFEKSNDIERIKKKKGDLLDKIKALRKQFNKHLDLLEHTIIAELDEEQTVIEKEIDADIIAVDHLIIASDKYMPVLASQYDEKQTFIAEKLGRAVLVDAVGFLQNAKISKRPMLKFEPNDDLCDAIEKSDRIGRIIKNDIQEQHTQPDTSEVFLKSISEINVRAKSDNNMCLINGTCQLPNGTILLTDYHNVTLKRLDNQLNVKDFLKLKSRPNGLCSVSPAEVAVRLRNKTIQFISIGQSLSHQHTISIKQTESDNTGLEYFRYQFWIPSANAVYIYSLSGSLVKKIETDSQGSTLFPNHIPQHISGSDDETKVYVAAGGDRVVVFNKDGDVIRELRDQRLDATRGLCVTKDDIVLVAGINSKNVVKFDRDGNSLGELVSSKDMLSRPISQCYDRTKCCLLVGYCLDKVQIFQLRQ